MLFWQLLRLYGLSQQTLLLILIFKHQMVSIFHVLNVTVNLHLLSNNAGNSIKLFVLNLISDFGRLKWAPLYGPHGLPISTYLFMWAKRLMIPVSQKEFIFKIILLAVHHFQAMWLFKTSSFIKGTLTAKKLIFHLIQLALYLKRKFAPIQILHHYTQHLPLLPSPHQILLVR